MYYVSYSFIPTKYAKEHGCKNERYSVVCENELEAIEVENDVYSLDGVSHIRVTTAPPKTRNVKFLKANEYLRNNK